MLAELFARQAALAARITGTSVPTALFDAWQESGLAAGNDKTSRESDETSFQKTAVFHGEAAAQALTDALSAALQTLDWGGTSGGTAAESESGTVRGTATPGRQSAAEAWNAAAALIAQNRQVTQNFTTQSADMASISRFFERDARRWG
jgi:hypothetical protein